MIEYRKYKSGRQNIMSIKKAEVLQLLNDGHPLIRIFYYKTTEYEIDRRKVNRRTAESIIFSEELTLGKRDFNGIAKHYYFKKDDSL
jgi:hypothetical protein